MPAKFKTGDRVIAIALPDGFPGPRQEVRDLVVIHTRLVTQTAAPAYYRVTTRGKDGRMVEGAERFFEVQA